MTDPVIILEAAGMAAVASIVLYSKRYATDHEDFQPRKFAATVIVGVACGIGLALTGDAVTQAAIEARLAAYAGVVILVETVVKTLVRVVKTQQPNKYTMR